ncbi:MAG: choice-of-anchor I family protein [Desulfobacterium sp.]|nr:choice-of-anchor I family protein [Desulfobacterium sp.]
MKQLGAIVLSFLSVLAFGCNQSADHDAPETGKFAVVSDPHFYDTGLGTTGTAFESYLAGDRKLLRESNAILDSAIDSIIAAKPEFIIFPGDLTKDGAKTSHQGFAQHLKRLEENNIKAYVICGNHDVNNPHAMGFSGETKTKVDHVTPDGFKEIYADYGYEEALYTDPDSLSYVVEPTDGTWLIAMDSCRYDTNLEIGTPITGGKFKPETRAWILGIIEEGKSKGKNIIGMMHHGILEHFTGQSQISISSDYVVADWRAVTSEFSKAGMNVVFTGHYHGQDISASAINSIAMTDIETGSLVTYPCPYRIVTINDPDTLDITTKYVTDIDYDTNGLSFTDYAANYLETGLVQLAKAVLTAPPAHGGFGMPDNPESDAVAQMITSAFTAHYKGDEAPDMETLGIINGFMKSGDLVKTELGKILHTLWTDLNPMDNQPETPISMDQKVEPALEVLGRFKTGVFDKSATEIVAYDKESERIFVTNANDKTIDIIDVSAPDNPLGTDQISLAPYGKQANSCAVKNGILVVAVENTIPQENGSLVFFNTDGTHLRTVQAGAMPDMVTFTPDGNHVLSANEGEPNGAYDVDPEGSVTIVDISNGIDTATVFQAGFTQFNGQKDELIQKGVRIYGPGATAAMDLEPEYIAVSQDSKQAFITLQENNAVARLDIEAHTITDIHPLGYKNHMQSGNGLDGVKDGKISITNQPLLGMYQPDSIASVEIDGVTYLVTANEGDARDYEDDATPGGGFSEEIKLKNADLDPETFPNADVIKSSLGSFKVTTTGDLDNDGDLDGLFSFGARSFSIWKASEGTFDQVYDSADAFEQIIAGTSSDYFNVSNDDNALESRSAKKGPEPEALAAGFINGRWIAFVGLERQGGIMIYDISNPVAPLFLDYINGRDYTKDPASGDAGDLGPEGFLFVPGEKSHTGFPMLITASEVSGTVTLYKINIK